MLHFGRDEGVEMAANNFRKILAFLAIFASKLTENRPGYDYFPGACSISLTFGLD